MSLPNRRSAGLSVEGIGFSPLNVLLYLMVYTERVHAGCIERLSNSSANKWAVRMHRDRRSAREQAMSKCTVMMMMGGGREGEGKKARKVTAQRDWVEHSSQRALTMFIMWYRSVSPHKYGMHYNRCFLLRLYPSRVTLTARPA